MIISIIVAMDERRGIGFRNKLPWRLSSDLKRFRELTMGHHIIVGRKTFESIGRPLPGRKMLIVTRNASYHVEGCWILHSIQAAVDFAKEAGETEAFICGGAQIFEQTLTLADRIYMTRVHAVVDADTFFPQWDDGTWREQESVHHEADEKNEYPFELKVFARQPISNRSI